MKKQQANAEMRAFYQTISHLPPDAQVIFRSVWCLMSTNWAPEQLWKRVLSKADKTILCPDAQIKDPIQYVLLHYKNADRMWRKLHRVSKFRAILDVALRTGNLSSTDYEYLLLAGGETYADEAEQLESFLRKKLTIEEEERKLYLHGEPQDVDWTRHETLWRFLQELVACCERREPLRTGDFYGNRQVKRSALPNVKRRLVELVPALDALIDADGHGGYVLRLDPVKEVGILRRMSGSCG